MTRFEFQVWQKICLIIFLRWLLYTSCRLRHKNFVIAVRFPASQKISFSFPNNLFQDFYIRKVTLMNFRDVNIDVSLLLQKTIFLSAAAASNNLGIAVMMQSSFCVLQLSAFFLINTGKYPYHKIWNCLKFCPSSSSMDEPISRRYTSGLTYCDEDEVRNSMFSFVNRKKAVNDLITQHFRSTLQRVWLRCLCFVGIVANFDILSWARASQWEPGECLIVKRQIFITCMIRVWI